MTHSSSSLASTIQINDDSDYSRFDVQKDYKPSAPTSEIVITSKSHPELWAWLNAQCEPLLRIHRLEKLSLSLLSNSKNRAKRARKKSKK
jgi:hypothetical protein